MNLDIIKSMYRILANVVNQLKKSRHRMINEFCYNFAYGKCEIYFMDIKQLSNET